MEKKSRRRSKFIAVVLTTLVLFTTLTTQIFADFAGDGISSGTPIYPDNGFTQIDIEYVSGAGGTSSIDNITYAILPMYSDGSLTSEVARGVYGTLTSQYYRYTTLITRAGPLRISQKQTFDAPLYNDASRLLVTYYAPIVFSNDFELTINAVTNNTSNTCRISNISATFNELKTTLSTQGITDGTLVYSDTMFIDGTFSNVPIGGNFPYTFSFSESVSDTSNLIVDLKLTFEISIIDTGVFSLSTTSNYLSEFPAYSQYDDVIVENITIEEVVPPPVYINKVPFAETIITSFADIAEIEIFGAFSIGDLLWAFVGIMALIAFLKLYAGG